MSDLCGDNRFELIEKYKKELIEATNIETAQDEMAVLDNILFRFWQMGWLDKLELPNDLISRQAAIEAFDCTNELIVGGEANAQNVVNYINKVVCKIKDLPSAQPDDAEVNYWHEKANSYEQTLVKLAQSRAEQPEIIRCKDCKHWKPDHTCREHSLVSPMLANEFCSRSERREG